MNTATTTNEITEIENMMVLIDFPENLTEAEFDAQKQALIEKSPEDTEFNRSRTVLKNLIYAIYAQWR